MASIRYSPRLLFSPCFTEWVRPDPLSLVDAGARGGMGEPWCRVDHAAIRVIGFEPDQKECDRLNQSGSGIIQYLPTALWSSAGKLKIHCAAVPSCSSVHPPNLEDLRRYEDPHWKPRETQRVMTVPSVPLDRILKEKQLKCDFLKVDTQGSEYEILKGGSATLKGQVLGVLVETWTQEVHRGQHLMGDVFKLLVDHGFSLFDVGIAAAWKRKIGAGLGLSGKSQVVGLDLLFFKNTNHWDLREAKPLTVIKAAGLFEVYGFPDYALELLDQAMACGVDPFLLKKARQVVVECSRKQRNPFKQGRLARLLGTSETDFASLHS